MNKRLLSTTIALCLTLVGAMAQRSYTFNAVALNVDGLPEKLSVMGIVDITINEGAPGAKGAAAMGNAIAKQNWDIVALSEDFNYHTELTDPLKSYYHIGVHGGSVEAKTSNETDGLGILVAKRADTALGTMTKKAWETNYGGSGLTTIGDNGADNLITKGFRYYPVTIANGIVVDVYVLHMDAGTADSDDDWNNGKDRNTIAREAQLAQLAKHIKENKNGRPILILGDTNCRYTREALKTGFIDVINADSRLTIKDVWVEKVWGGTYPTYGSESMMTHIYGDQRGEVVDKIFYINDSQSSLTIEANSYFHNTKFGVSDHYPVIANLTVTDKNGKPNTESDWTVVGGSAEKDNTITGSKVASGKIYFVKNVGSGTYLKSGAKWGTQAAEGSAGIPITFNLENNGKYTLRTTLTMNGNASERGIMGSSDEPYMDQSGGSWTLEPVYGDDNKGYQYQLLNENNKALAYTGEDGHPVYCVNKNATDNNQRWVLLTEDDIRTQMTAATAAAPYDITPLLKAANFDKINTENNTTNWGIGFSNYTVGGIEGGGTNEYEYCAVLNSTTNAISISQTISNLPKGNYSFTGQGFYRYQEKKTKSNKDTWTEKTMEVAVSVGGKSVNLAQNTSLATEAGAGDAARSFKAGNHNFTLSPTLSNNGSLTVQVLKPTTSANSSSGSWIKTYYYYYNWVCIDNFKLVYTGDGSDGGTYDPNLEYRNALASHINSTAEKVKQLNAAGQAAYDISTVIYRYNNDMVTSNADVDALSAMVDEAYANALTAHNNQLVKDAINGDGNVTALIINPSFETGDLTGWTVGGGQDVGVYPNSNGTYAINNCDGNYVFNSWNGDDGHGSSVKQTITGVPNGLYELKAVLASFGTADGKSHDYRMYLIGNGYHTSVTAVGGKAVGQEATLYFLVEDGTATIGAIGGNKGGGSEFIHYWPWEGCFLKADNFRLRYICDASHGRLKLALNEAEAASLDEYGQEALNVSKYQAMYDNKSLTTDGTAEAAAVRSALQTAAKAQRTAETDMTWAITNPSFETGDYTGWSTTVGWDTGAKPQENGTYTTAGTDGHYMFNTWNNDGNATNSGVNAAITQTVTGIPNGRYILKAMVATDAGNSMYLAANGETATIEASGNGASSGVFPSVECEVTNHTLDIKVGGVNNCWYKCDDFHLTFLGNELTLDENEKAGSINDWYTSVTVKRTIKPNTWSTFVVPFDIPADILGDWEVKELTDAEVKNGNITLTFSDAEDGIKAGVPYMVRNTTMKDNLTAISMENTMVNTTLHNTSIAGVVDFIGTYENDYVPEGSFFISGNKFYLATGNGNILKGYRAYLTPKNANVRSMSYRWDDEETTGIEEATDAEPTVVAIYNASGMCLDDMQQGLNILLMSNGKTMKVIIK